MRSIRWIIAAGTLGLCAGCYHQCDKDAMACRFECSTSADCPAGRQCMHEHAHNLSFDTCELPCSRNDAGVLLPRCPDSPDLSACTDDLGQRYCPTTL